MYKYPETTTADVMNFLAHEHFKFSEMHFKFWLTMSSYVRKISFRMSVHCKLIFKMIEEC